MDACTEATLPQVKTKKKPKPKPRPLLIPEFTDGEWLKDGLAIVVGEEGTIAIGSTMRRSLSHCSRDIRLMSASKELLATCLVLLNTLVLSDEPDADNRELIALRDMAMIAVTKAGVKGDTP